MSRGTNRLEQNFSTKTSHNSKNTPQNAGFVRYYPETTAKEKKKLDLLPALLLR